MSSVILFFFFFEIFLSPVFSSLFDREKMWARFAVTKLWANKFLEEGMKAAQLETSKSWQDESPHMEEFELLRACNTWRWDGTWMRPAIMARESGRLGGFGEM